jgi:hypothetical protein
MDREKQMTDETGKKLWSKNMKNISGGLTAKIRKNKANNCGGKSFTESDIGILKVKAICNV